MTEILTILIHVMSFFTVTDGTRTATMLPFTGEARSPYFCGTVMQGGVDTQRRDTASSTLSARYMLLGKDCDSTDCHIFIENNGRWGEPYTHPTIITDSPALSFLNTDSLLGQLDFANNQLTIRIYRVEKENKNSEAQ